MELGQKKVREESSHCPKRGIAQEKVREESSHYLKCGSGPEKSERRELSLPEKSESRQKKVRDKRVPKNKKASPRKKSITAIPKFTYCMFLLRPQHTIFHHPPIPGTVNLIHNLRDLMGISTNLHLNTHIKTGILKIQENIKFSIQEVR